MHTINSLAIALSRLASFENPQFKLEQYITPSQIAAEFLFMTVLAGKKVVDLGCGTGILTIGAALQLAEEVIGVEIDESALSVAQVNLASVSDMIEAKVSFVVSQVGASDIIEGLDVSDVDVVMMNPPFGVRQKNVDKLFLQHAIKMAPLIMSMHKTSTMEYLTDWMLRQGYTLEKRVDISYYLANTMKHHTKKKQYIEVTMCVWSKE